MKEVFLTEQGLEELKQKLDYLLSEKRKEVSEKIKIAREFGDLSENAEYDAAKEEQGFVEQEIKDIQEKILHAKIIDESQNKNEVSLGSTVTIFDMEDDEDDEDSKMTYKIVGTTEANYAEGKISNESPLGNALIGSKKDDIVSVPTPNGGTVEYKIINID